VPRDSHTNALAATLTRLLRANIRCIGATLRQDGSVALLVEHREAPERTEDAMRAAWPRALMSVLVDYTAEGPRFAITVRRDLWLCWRAPTTAAKSDPPATCHPPAGTRILAFDVSLADDENPPEVVLASTAIEAAICFTRGWDLSQGTIIFVVEQPLDGVEDIGPPAIFRLDGDGIAHPVALVHSKR